jgi:predicted DNA-binding protein with PD1-like motif
MKVRVIFTVLFVTFLSVITSMAQEESSKASFITIRLKPHRDLKKELMTLAVKEKIKAGFITTCVGSLEQMNLRYANQSTGTSWQGHFEIISLVGTFNETAAHLHLSV